MQEKTDSELMRRQNRRLVLRALRHHGPLARVDLGRITGLAPASITAISNELISNDILFELESPSPPPATVKRGRPTIQLGFKADAGRVLVINIAIDTVMLALVDYSGEIMQLERLHLSTHNARAEQFAVDVAAIIRRFLERLSVTISAVKRIGIAIQGVADSKQGSIVWSPAFAARDIPLGESLSKLLGIPCHVANDANMMAEGFLSTEPTARGRTIATVFTGYGVGMGLIIGGNVYHGATGGAAEFGHMNHIPRGALCRCGKRGCIEAYAADYGILRSATGACDDEVPKGRVDRAAMVDVLVRARAGDEQALSAFAKAGEALGYGIGRMVALLNPDRVVVAGPGLDAQTLIEPALRRAVEESLVEELRRNVIIDIVPVETDLILRGTAAALLRDVDAELAARGGARTGRELAAAE